MTSMWKITLIVSFLIFYVGFGLASFATDMFHGNADPSDIYDYVTFGKFRDYSEGFEQRADDFYNAETGALKSDAALSMFFLGVAQFSFIGLLTMIMWFFTPTDKKRWIIIPFGLALLFTSLLMYWATGDPVIGLFKLLWWGIAGTPG